MVGCSSTVPQPYITLLTNRLQETLLPGKTIVPIIRMSDQTHLSNLSWDKKAWPTYIPLGNLLVTRCNAPGSMVVLLLVLLAFQANSRSPPPQTNSAAKSMPL